MSSLGKKYPQFQWVWDKVIFTKSYCSGELERIHTDGECISYMEEYLFYVSAQQVEEEIMHVVLHNELCHKKRFLMYPDIELKEAIMDFQVSLIMYEMGMLKNEKKESLEYLLDNVCREKCDFSLYHELQKDKERKNRFLNHATMLHSDNHEKWSL